MAEHSGGEEPDLVQVFTSSMPGEVEMAHDLLTHAGIDAFVLDSAMSRMLGSTAAIPARLVVRADDVDDARAMLKELGFTGFIRE
jgi:hypothetical protein